MMQIIVDLVRLLSTLHFPHYYKRGSYTAMPERRKMDDDDKFA